MSYAKHPILQVALRELQTHLAQPKVALVLVAVVCGLTLARPFGTAGLGLAAAAGYWALIACASYGLGFVLNILAAHWLRAHPPGVIIAGFAGLNGAAVALLVMGVNLALGFWRLEHISVMMMAQIMGAAALVTGLLAMIDAPMRPQAQTPSAPQAPAPPMLLDRLAPPLRGPIVALSAEDHYTRIRTTRGEELVLMPLRDAIREAAPTEGVQLHRSHWVATAHIAQVARGGGKARVVLRDGAELPVSRNNAPRLRELGF